MYVCMYVCYSDSRIVLIQTQVRTIYYKLLSSVVSKILILKTRSDAKPLVVDEITFMSD